MAKLIINKQNYFHNLNTINDKLQNINKIAVVLKDNAYGHGLMNIAKIANEYGINKAIVRTLKEAEAIKDLFDLILVLSDIPPKSYSHTFHITINSLQDIEKICKNTIVHLKVDTGMHRNGIKLDDLKVAIYRILEKNLVLGGVFTHHRSSDVLSSEFYWQEANFYQVKQDVKNICEQLNIGLPLFHSLNSSGVFRTNNIEDDFVRVGIASYGYSENQFPLYIPNLKPVASLVANKITSRKITKGSCVGYGGSFIANKDMTVSTYDIGYGDGFFRLSPQKEIYFTPDGYQILGKVSMDNISIDSDDDEVVLFDDVSRLAQINNTITYEILTSLSKDIPRIVV